MTQAARFATSAAVVGGRRRRWRTSTAPPIRTTTRGRTWCSPGTSETRRWPGSAAGGGRGDADEAEWEEHHVLDERHGVLHEERQHGRPGHDQHAERHALGRPAALGVAGREEGQGGERPGRELHRRDDAEHEARQPGLAPLRQHHGEEQQRDDRHVVPAGGERERGGGQHGHQLQRAHLALGRASTQRQRAGDRQQGDHAEEDAGVGELDRAVRRARQAEERHDRQVGEERLEGRLALVGRDDVPVAHRGVIGVLALGQPGAGLLDDGDLGLLGVPDDLE